MKNWLITWESWSPKSIKAKDKIAAILNGGHPAEYVREIVELLYINHEFIPSERLRYADGKFNPYPAQLHEINGVLGEIEIICGHDPYLRARLVDNCRVEGNGSKEKLAWVEVGSQK